MDKDKDMDMVLTVRKKMHNTRKNIVVLCTLHPISNPDLNSLLRESELSVVNLVKGMKFG